jgi:flagellar basal body-associated protein FliL
MKKYFLVSLILLVILLAAGLFSYFFYFKNLDEEAKTEKINNIYESYKM